MTDEINGKIYKCPTIKGEKIYKCESYQLLFSNTRIPLSLSKYYFLT